LIGHKICIEVELSYLKRLNIVFCEVFKHAASADIIDNFGLLHAKQGVLASNLPYEAVFLEVICDNFSVISANPDII